MCFNLHHFLHSVIVADQKYNLWNIDIFAHSFPSAFTPCLDNVVPVDQ